MKEAKLMKGLLAYPEIIQKEQLVLLKLVDEENDLREKLDKVKQNTMIEIEREYEAKKDKGLSTIAKREKECELRLKESKAGSFYLPKYRDAVKASKVKRIEIERLVNELKSYRSIAYILREK